MTFNWDEIEKEEAERRKKWEGYLASGYTGNNCTNCGRNRVLDCANGNDRA